MPFFETGNSRLGVFRLVTIQFRDKTTNKSMTNSKALRISALMGFFAVGLGAFGAHGLKDILTQNATATIWEKAVFYHFIHTVMLFILANRSPFRFGPWLSFLMGIIIFSGSLYLLAVTNVKWLGAITPIGGLSFLAGWLWLIIAPERKTKPE
jgi:uncharacterized membrane protein YgdD (TMEM256/DUF423 family)